MPARARICWLNWLEKFEIKKQMKMQENWHSGNKTIDESEQKQKHPARTYTRKLLLFQDIGPSSVKSHDFKDYKKTETKRSNTETNQLPTLIEFFVVQKCNGKIGNVNDFL